MTAIPSHLYKYQPVTARTLENLKARTLWFSSPSAFNDPFDCAIEIRMKTFDDTDLSRAHEYVSSRAELDSELAAEIMTNGEPNEGYREVFQRTFADGAWRQEVEAIRQRVGVACFSAKSDDLLMWGHYADGHRGFCLEFSTLVEPFSRAMPVAYLDSVPEVNPLDILDGRSTSQDLIEAMLCTKHTCWQYEQEWRVIGVQAGAGHTYSNASLTGLYLGESMPRGQKDLIGQLLHGSQVQIYDMRRGEGGFVVEPSPVVYVPHQFGPEDVPPAR